MQGWRCCWYWYWICLWMCFPKQMSSLDKAVGVRDRTSRMTFGKRQFTSLNNVSNLTSSNSSGVTRFSTPHSTITASALQELRESIKWSNPMCSYANDKQSNLPNTMFPNWFEVYLSYHIKFYKGKNIKRKRAESREKSRNCREKKYCHTLFW